MLEMARSHSESDGCMTLRTNTRTRMLAERGTRPGGGEAEDKSQTEAVIIGDVERVTRHLSCLRGLGVCDNRFEQPRTLFISLLAGMRMRAHLDLLVKPKTGMICSVT